MKLIELHWNNLKGEGHVKYTKTFEEAHWVVRADMLQDCIVDLQDKYSSLLSTPKSTEPEDSLEDLMKLNLIRILNNRPITLGYVDSKKRIGWVWLETGLPASLEKK